MRESLPIGPLLLTVFTSILEVFLLCLAGYILAWKGILDKKTQKQLNRLNVSLFTPSLLFSKVAFFLSPEKLRELWIIPIFFVIVTLVSMSAAFVLSWVFRLKKSQRSFAMAAAMFMNSNSLPIALMQSLVVTVHGLKWTKDDNKNAMLGRALTYLVLYSTLGMILRWSFGVRLLAQADEENEEGTIRLPDDPENAGADSFSRPQRGPGFDIHSDGSDTSDTEHSHFQNILGPASPTVASTSASTSYPSVIVDDIHAHPEIQTQTQFQPQKTRLAPPKPSPRRRSSRFYNSFPNSPNQSFITLPGIQSEAQSEVPSRTGSNDNSDEEYQSGSDDYDSNEEGATTGAKTNTLNQLESPDIHPSGIHAHAHSAPTPHRRRSQSHYVRVTDPGPTSLRKIKRHIYRLYITFIDFMTVPLWAAFLSIIVALVQPLQHVLDDHMAPVKGALTSAGNCSIPVTLIVLGGYFFKGKEMGDEGANLSKAKGKSDGKKANGVRETGGVQGNGYGQGLQMSPSMLFESLKEAFLSKEEKARRRRRHLVEDGDDEESETSALLSETENRHGDGETVTARRRINTTALANGHNSNPKAKKTRENDDTQEEDRPHPGETRTVVIAVLARMVVTPLFLLPIMALSKYFDLQAVVDDPIFVLANVLLVSSPPALTLAQITQAASGDAFERLISRTIFWAYCVVTPPATIGYIVLALLMTKL
ncbi:hypothetical protein D9758_003057 [Tetrapyrgos nigripes]|uniref:PIN-like protein n=1 Tax=Tetrapyrgos nigripes TaxID=182062 RepID=A0A8H5GQA8_9AGAR|nr:hypothetical protein D9758_003057 [Tetrapyrgos nigripes]